MPSTYVIQLSEASWLVLDGTVRARWLIVKAPLIHKGTGETHVMHRVELWSLVTPRPVLSVHDGLEAAKAWCRDQAEAPDFSKPARKGYGSATPPEEQKQRWAAGLNPLTGEPRALDS